jgi:hypothetical protein
MELRQATFFSALPTLAFRGSAMSAASFWVSAVA